MLNLSETHHKGCGKRQREGGAEHGGVWVQEIYHDLHCGRPYWKEEKGGRGEALLLGQQLIFSW